MDYQACDEAQRDERPDFGQQEISWSWQGTSLQQNQWWFQMGQLASSQSAEVPSKEIVDLAFLHSIKTTVVNLKLHLFVFHQNQRKHDCYISWEKNQQLAWLLVWVCNCHVGFYQVSIGCFLIFAVNSWIMVVVLGSTPGYTVGCGYDILCHVVHLGSRWFQNIWSGGWSNASVFPS